MKFTIDDASLFYTEAEALLEKYPKLKNIGKHSKDDRGLLILECEDFSIVQQIMNNVYETVVLEKEDDNSYLLTIYDGYLE